MPRFATCLGRLAVALLVGLNVPGSPSARAEPVADPWAEAERATADPAGAPAAVGKIVEGLRAGDWSSRAADVVVSDR